MKFQTISQQWQKGSYAPGNHQILGSKMIALRWSVVLTFFRSLMILRSKLTTKKDMTCKNPWELHVDHMSDVSYLPSHCKAKASVWLAWSEYLAHNPMCRTRRPRLFLAKAASFSQTWTSNCCTRAPALQHFPEISIYRLPLSLIWSYLPKCSTDGGNCKNVSKSSFHIHRSPFSLISYSPHLKALGSTWASEQVAQPGGPPPTKISRRARAGRAAPKWLPVGLWYSCWRLNWVWNCLLPLGNDVTEGRWTL